MYKMYFPLDASMSIPYSIQITYYLYLFVKNYIVWSEKNN